MAILDMIITIQNVVLISSLKQYKFDLYLRKNSKLGRYLFLQTPPYSCMPLKITVEIGV